jgi:zinc/manganese transport system substrate-binding protein
MLPSALASRPARCAVLLSGALLLSACGRATQTAAGPTARGVIRAVGAENEYADVIRQIGGRYVSVTAIMSNPNSDPHSYEASPGVAQAVGGAGLVVQNGAGYDAFMNKIEAGSPHAGRRVIDVQELLGLPADTENPHLWYSPQTMPRLAGALVSDLSALAPSHRAYFATRAQRFRASLRPWERAMAAFRRRYPHVAVATTEPVGDYLLSALGADDLTPWEVQADIMNGVDLAPQAVGLQDALLTGHRARALLYNQQVTDTVTQSFRQVAVAHRVPVVALYETMPAGYSYQSWMLAEVRALQRAVSSGRSTTRL